MNKTDFLNYYVTNDGRIFNREKELKYFKSNKYLQVVMFDNDNKRYILGVHTVVAMFLSPDWFPGCNVHHIDENTHNNNIDNLVVLTRSEHSRLHANPQHLINYIKKNGQPCTGKKRSDEFRRKCSESAKKRWEREKT